MKSPFLSHSLRKALAHEIVCALASFGCEGGGIVD